MTLKPIDTPSVGTPTAHSSSGLVQPMFHTASATSDTNGNITFTFGGVFTGQILIGSFSCPSAPYTAQFTAYNNSQEVYSWQSSNNPGPLRVSENQQITVSGTGLVRETLYVMNWVGYSTVGGFAPQIVPASHTDVTISTNQGGLFAVQAASSPSGGVQVLPAPPVGMIYRLHLLGINSQGVASTSAGWFFVETTGSVQNTGYLYNGVFASGQAVSANASLNGVLADGPITFEVLGSFTIYLDLRYDLVQL